MPVELPMAQPFKLKQSNALKHGVYSTIGLPPGESPARFKKLREMRRQMDQQESFRFALQYEAIDLAMGGSFC
jgi:hypothetical protein